MISTADPNVAAGSKTAAKTHARLISFEGVTKSFVSGRRGKTQKREVLKRLSFTISEGEFVSVIGPSGGGKTTLLNLLAGLTLPTSGRVVVGGETVTAPGADRGVVFQQDAIFPWRTVRQNVEYGLERAGLPREERRAQAKQYIEMVGLSEFADYLPKQLSGGMKKRVAIAAVLANGPEVLLMDEPFGALDYSTKVHLQEQVLGIWDKNRVTTVFVTHDIEEALYLSDRILVLANGDLAEDFTVEFPRPRQPALRTSPEIQDAKRQLWGYL